MQMLYNSDAFVVVQFDAVPAHSGAQPMIGRSGYEIVDKLTRKEIFIEGLMAETFKAGVQTLVDSDPTPEAFDEYIGRFTVLAQQPVVVH